MVRGGTTSLWLDFWFLTQSKGGGSGIDSGLKELVQAVVKIGEMSIRASLISKYGIFVLGNLCDSNVNLSSYGFI